MTANGLRDTAAPELAQCVIRKKEESDVIVALIGNPNVGKSTLFNALTGLNQHTGNWPGKTVAIAQGRYTYKGRGYILVDLPGTYSLLSQSEEERITAEFLLSGQADCALVLADATCLERNLNLALQVLELTDKTILCVNLLDEAERHGIEIDLRALERELGIPVAGTAAGNGRGLEQLQEKLRNLNDGFLSVHPGRLFSGREAMLDDLNQACSDRVSALISDRAEAIAAGCVRSSAAPAPHWMDRIALGRWSGRVLLVLLLLTVFWLTIRGANYPSMLLQAAFDRLGAYLHRWMAAWPWWISGLLLDGVYSTSARVISVMLPPMAIFFPLFTVLEDLGYLPRAAFLMDHCFQCCGSCGKQVLTMSMGFGCNAAGVIGCRIIASPRERLLAIVTNALVPCNGRFPALITLICLFFSERSLPAAAMLTGFVLLGVGATLLSSRLLNRTVLAGKESHFIMEMPPYRRPQIGKILLRALLDRTMFVLARAAAVAAPAGAVIWCLSQLTWKGMPLLQSAAALLDPVGMFLGMNGAVLLAFFLSFPANELLIPLTVMILQGTQGALAEVGDAALGTILTAGGWTQRTALCVMVFLLFHWPCSTTCLTIRKETGSWKWTLAAMLLPTAIGVFLCSLLGHL